MKYLILAIFAAISLNAFGKMENHCDMDGKVCQLCNCESKTVYAGSVNGTMCPNGTLMRGHRVTRDGLETSYCYKVEHVCNCNHMIKLNGFGK